MNKVFNIIPEGFFNPLSSGSNNIANAGCLLEIYEQYDMEVSYRISRRVLRDDRAVERRSDGKLIGRAGISDREGVSEPEIGYVIAAGCRRQGYAREALEAIIRYASEELGMDRLAAYTMADNDASVGILKKLGFAKSGEHEISGRMHDKYVLDICGRI